MFFMTITENYVYVTFCGRCGFGFVCMISGVYVHFRITQLIINCDHSFTKVSGALDVGSSVIN
jgi:hypothetical protein